MSANSCNLKQRRLLMLNASWSEIPFIAAARKMGFYVITTSTKPDYPGHKYADEYVYGDYRDTSKMIEIIKQYDIDAISWGCSDTCALTACYLGEKLGFKGHDTYLNAQIIHLKDKFKEFAKEHNIKTPVSNNYSSVDEALASASKVKFPVIIKPVDLAGGQGIQVVKKLEEYIGAIKNAFDKSKIKRILVEPFIEGTLHSLNTFIVNQKVVSYCTANDYSYLNKLMTNSGISPADNWKEAVKQLIPETEKVARILGLVDGQLHMQYIMQPDGECYIIEMMRRNIGNNWSVMLNDSVGVNWAEWVIRAEAGMDCHNIPESKEPKGYYGYHMLMAPRNGKFLGVEVEKSIQDHIYHLTVKEQPGFEISDYLNYKIGNAMVHFDTMEEKDYFMPRINELIKVVVE